MVTARGGAPGLLLALVGLALSAQVAAETPPSRTPSELPSVEVFEGTPENKVNVLDIFKGKKGILFGVPGAFTPACSNTHLPSYVNNYRHLKSAGVEVIACVAVNDPFVMTAWGEQARVEGKIRMLADTNGALTKALGKDVEVDVLGGMRSQRYALVIEDGKIVQDNTEPDGFGTTVSLAPEMFQHLQYSGHVRDEL